MVKDTALRGRRMLEGPEWKGILAFAVPIMLSQLLQQLYSTVDGIIVGNFVSEGALAAVGASTVVTVGINSVSFGMANGCSVAVSQYYGAGRREDMRATAATALVLLASLGLAAMLLCMSGAGFVAAHILDIGSESVRAAAAAYFRIFAVGFLFQFTYNSIAAILRSVGDSRAVLYFLIVSSVVNVVLDLLFVAVFRWGVAGAALATVISQASCMTVSWIYMQRKYELFRFRAREIRPQREKLRLCVRLGVPTALQHLIVSCGNVALQRLVDSFGSSTMAAYAVGRTYDHYIAVPCTSMFQSLTSFAGQNTGAGRYDRVKRGAYQGIAIAVIFVAVLGALIYCFAPQLSALYGVSGGTLGQAVAYLRFIAVAYPLMAMYLPMNGIFQGSGNPLAAAVSAVIALSARVGAAYLMVYGLGMDHSSGWKSYAVGWACALIYVTIHFFRGRWMNRSIVRPAGPAEENAG